MTSVGEGVERPETLVHCWGWVQKGAAAVGNRTDTLRTWTTAPPSDPASPRLRIHQKELIGIAERCPGQCRTAANTGHVGHTQCPRTEDRVKTKSGTWSDEMYFSL